MKRVNLILSAVLSVLLFSCTTNSQRQTPEWKARHVVLIGLDGWTARSIQNAQMPTVQQMMQNGSYTSKKRSALPSSSAINWATMFMGAGPELHGFTEWGSKKPELESRTITHYGLFPSIWGTMRDQYPDTEIGYFYQWDGFKYVAELKAMSTETHTKVEDETLIASDANTALQAAQYIQENKPTLVGVFIDEPDHTGHTHGFDSPEYYEKLKDLDKYVALIIEATKKAGIYDDTIFILTSDHGGINRGHGGKTMEEMETAFIMMGKGIKANYRMDDISMMQYDVAPTIAHIFGLEVPQVWVGRPMKQVFSDETTSHR